MTTRTITETALKNSQNFIYNSQLMNFEWSNENKQYLFIKLEDIFARYRESLENDFLSNEAKDFSLGILQNRISLIQFNQFEDKAGYVTVHRLDDSFSNMKEEQYEDNVKLYKQDITIKDFEYVMNKYILSQIKLLSPGNVMKTIIHDFVNNLSKTNEKNKQEFTI